jgi:hypothetical protein
MSARVGGLLVWFVFPIAAMAVGSVLEFDLLGYIVIPAAILWFSYSWFRGHREQVGDANDLQWLEELAHEHKQGICDHTEMAHSPHTERTRTLFGGYKALGERPPHSQR